MRSKCCGRISFVFLVVSIVLTLLLFNAMIYFMFITNTGIPPLNCVKLLIENLFSEALGLVKIKLGKIDLKLNDIYKSTGKLRSNH